MTTRRRPRRLAAWGLFALVGLGLTATWAAGVTTTGAGSSTAGAGEPAATAPPTADTPALDGFVSTTDLDAGLPMNFSGRWGNIPVDVTDGGAGDPDDNTSTTALGDYQLFEVDLTSFAGTQDFFVEVALANKPDDFSVLQIEFVKVDTECATADLDNTGATGYATETLYVENTDSTAVFDLEDAGGDTVCIGVADTNGVGATDEDGTFIRRADGGTSAPNPMPTFMAILGEYAI